MKTKVIAFRVTQNEYDAIVYEAGMCFMTPSTWLRAFLPLDRFVESYNKEQKRREAKAKRDAKKAANGQ